MNYYRNTAIRRKDLQATS